jgi:hypothetical protein
MAMPAELFNQIMQLSAEDLRRLRFIIDERLGDDVDPNAAEAWEEEIARRSAEVAAGTADTVSLEEFELFLEERRRARASATRTRSTSWTSS